MRQSTEREGEFPRGVSVVWVVKPDTVSLFLLPVYLSQLFPLPLNGTSLRIEASSQIIVLPVVFAVPLSSGENTPLPIVARLFSSPDR